MKRHSLQVPVLLMQSPRVVCLVRPMLPMNLAWSLYWWKHARRPGKGFTPMDSLFLTLSALMHECTTASCVARILVASRGRNAASDGAQAARCCELLQFHPVTLFCHDLVFERRPYASLVGAKNKVQLEGGV